MKRLVYHRLSYEVQGLPQIGLGALFSARVSRLLPTTEPAVSRQCLFQWMDMRSAC